MKAIISQVKSALSNLYWDSFPVVQVNSDNKITVNFQYSTADAGKKVFEESLARLWSVNYVVTAESEDSLSIIVLHDLNFAARAIKKSIESLHTRNSWPTGRKYPDSHKRT